MTSNLDPQTTGVIIVDHGSRREQSNEMLDGIVQLYRQQTHWQIVEPAHMELAEPSIATAFDRCVEQGARTVVVFPYFLLPGRHWKKDIPALTSEAAAKHPDVKFLVTAPFATHPMMLDIIDQRIDQCVGCATGQSVLCDACAGLGACQFNGALVDQE